MASRREEGKETTHEIIKAKYTGPEATRSWPSNQYSALHRTRLDLPRRVQRSYAPPSCCSLESGAWSHLESSMTCIACQWSNAQPHTSFELWLVPELELSIEAAHTRAHICAQQTPSRSQL